MSSEKAEDSDAEMAKKLFGISSCDDDISNNEKLDHQTEDPMNTDTQTDNNTMDEEYSELDEIFGGEEEKAVVEIASKKKDSTELLEGTPIYTVKGDLPMPASHDYALLKLPPHVKCEWEHAFDPVSTIDRELSSSLSTEIPATLAHQMLSTMRFRAAFDPQTHAIRTLEGNARLVKWSDGSQTMLIGGANNAALHYEVVSLELISPHPHLFHQIKCEESKHLHLKTNENEPADGNENEMLVGMGSFQYKIHLRPFDSAKPPITSATVPTSTGTKDQVKMAALLPPGRYMARVKTLDEGTMTESPEMQQARLAKVAHERLRAQRAQEQRRRNLTQTTSGRNKTTLTASFLEEDASDYDDDEARRKDILDEYEEDFIDDSELQARHNDGGLSDAEDEVYGRGSRSSRRQATRSRR